MAGAGDHVSLQEHGTVPADKMFASVQTSNTILTWALHFVGFFMMSIGLSTMFSPFVVLANVLPFLGNILGMGISLFSGFIAFVLSFITIALAWIAYRPVVGISLSIIGVGTFAFFYFFAKKKKEQIQQVAVTI